MSSPKQIVSKRKSPWYGRLFTVGLVLVAILLAIAFPLVWHELDCKRQLDGQLQQARSMGIPVDNESLTRRYREQSTEEGSQEWGEVLALVSNRIITSRVSWFDSPEYTSDDAKPNDFKGSEKYYETMNHFLEEAKPVIAQVKKLKSTGKPVWQRIRFEGMNTLLPSLQNSRSVMHLLSLEFDYALHVADRERAIQALDAMQNCIDAFNSDFCYVANLVNVACEFIQYGRIRESLASSMWTDEDLVGLMKRIGEPIDIRSVWQNSLDGELAMAMETDFYDGDLSGMDAPRLVTDMRGLLRRAWKLPSVRKYVWDQTQKYRNIADEGLDGLSTRTQKIDDAMIAEMKDSMHASLLAQMSGSKNQVAKAWERFDMMRRLTLTALALKRYRMDKNSWPAQLGELEAYGLSERDWHETKFSPFGYHVEEDGKTALLWGYAYPQTEHSSVEKLKEALENPSTVDYLAKVTAP